MQKQFLISICIPSYNRPNELKRLLESIDTNHINSVQIVICEDKAPKRLEVRAVVNDFQAVSLYNVKYVENEENCGHGKNLRECIRHADGEYIVYMGDDDMFIPKKFDQFYEFVQYHTDYGYILRSHASLSTGGSKPEYFRYYSSDKTFAPGLDAYVDFFQKSTSMSGFTIKRDLVKDITIDTLDKTLLFQLYMMAEVCLNYPSAYCNTPFVYVVSNGTSFFGKNEKEKGLYKPETLVTTNVNFIKSFFTVSKYIDNKYKINSTCLIQYNISKYSYPILAYSRKTGIKNFKKQCKQYREIGLDDSKYFNFYYYMLLFFGEKFNSAVIRFIKKIFGRRLTL
jgi:abequosyltransferase